MLEAFWANQSTVLSCLPVLLLPSAGSLLGQGQLQVQTPAGTQTQVLLCCRQGELQGNSQAATCAVKLVFNKAPIAAAAGAPATPIASVDTQVLWAC